MPLPFPTFRWLAVLLALAAPLLGQEPLTIKMSILPGLKFDQVRFAVPPGAKVVLKLQNPDQMIHNFVITEPGARAEIVALALALGAEGPAKNFIPDSPKILQHTKALNPGESADLAFTAPAAEGVYPYVCTFMGHGFVMYGAMYVTTKPLPPLDSDPNVPPVAVAISDASDFSHTVLSKPVVGRTFLPDCGPAAIAVGLPEGESYVFDAGLCRLRYAWKGGYVDNGEHWSGKGDAFAKVVGHIYYRAPEVAMIRVGDASAETAARWKGYELGTNGPTFRYTLNGCEVSERPQVLPGGKGIVFAYAIASQLAPVFLVTDPAAGAAFTSSAGTWRDGVLTLNAQEAANFTLTMTERPGVEPLRYWSMNDVLFANHKDPAPGVVGRAFTPGGTDGKPKRLATGVKLSALTHGATFLSWVRLKPPKAGAADDDPAPLFSAGNGPNGFSLEASGPADEWFHYAVAIDEKGQRATYLNGQLKDRAEGAPLAGEDELYLGSVGEKQYLKGLLDEVRLYDRVLSDREVQAIYLREARNLKGDR